MPFQKVVPGDKWKPKASFHNALVELVNKRDEALKPQPLPKELFYDGCVDATSTGSGASIINPFELVVQANSVLSAPVTATPMEYCLKNKPYVYVEKPTAPYTYPTYYENTSPFLGITQSPIRPGSLPGKVRLLGSSWLKLTTDQYDDIVTYGQTHLNFIPGQGIRGATRGPIRILEPVVLNSEKWAKVFMCDYTVTSIVAISHTTTGIPPMVGTTPGSASCELVWLDPRTKGWTPLGVNRTIYNIAEEAVEANTIIQAKVESYSGAFVVDFEICPVPAS